MAELLAHATAFPAGLFSSALVVVLAYWLFVLVGAVGVDALDGGEGIDAADTAASGAGGLPAGVPVAVSLTLLTLLAWFASLTVSVATDSVWLRAAALPFALGAAWWGTRLVLRPLRRLAARRETGIRHAEFVGRTCVVRTGRVGPGFGQAEVTAPDGSTALVQVRAEDGPDTARLTAGSSALLWDYDPAGGFFRVAPFVPPFTEPSDPPDTGRPA